MEATHEPTLAQQAQELIRRAGYLAIERKGPCPANNIAGSCGCDRCARIGHMLREADRIPGGIAALEQKPVPARTET